MNFKKKSVCIQTHEQLQNELSSLHLYDSLLLSKKIGEIIKQNKSNYNSKIDFQLTKKRI